MAEKIGGAPPQPAVAPGATPPLDPKVALLEQVMADAVSRGRRDDPLIISLQKLISEMKGEAKPTPT